MNTTWIILSLVFGILFFSLYYVSNSVAIEGFGAITSSPGLFSLLEKIWPEVERGMSLSVYTLLIKEEVGAGWVRL